MPISNARRHYLLQRLFALETDEPTEAGVWRAKQEAIEATDLPDNFPSRAALVAVGYSAVEDLEGAAADELQRNVGLSASQAAAVVSAASELL